MEIQDIIKEATGNNIELVKLNSPEKWGLPKSYYEDKEGNLVTLNLRETGITRFHFSEKLVGELQYLEKLDISRNRLTDISFGWSLPALVLLDISYNNRIFKSVSFEASFPALKFLYVYKSQLQSIRFKSVMPVLDTLHLSENQLKVFSLPRGFECLVSLYLENNQLTEFTMNPGEVELLEFLSLKGNPLGNIPKEIFDKSGNVFDAVRTHLKGLRKGKKAYLHEAKMILVGNGEVGKSSIRIKLKDRNAPLPKTDDRTPGLHYDIEQYPIKDLPTEITGLDQPIDFTLNIWDFGGQGKYREIQFLFCTRKSIYVYVTSPDDKLKDENYVGWEYWLQMIKAFGHDKEKQNTCPVLVVVNKIESDPDFTIPLESYKAALGNIVKESYKISCLKIGEYKYKSRFDNLVEGISFNLEHIGEGVFTDQYGSHWLEVKKCLEGMKHENFISLERYFEICTKEGLENDEARQWLTTLTDLGTVIYFPQNESLKDMIILNHNWVKDAFVNVVDAEEVFISNGILKSNSYKYIWNTYPVDAYEKLVALLLAYDLCFPQEDVENKVLGYVVPSKLPEEKKEIPKEAKGEMFEIKLQFDPFIPAGIVNKLMSRLYKQIYSTTEAGAYRWKNGFILVEDLTSFALLQEVWEQQSIDLRFQGEKIKSLFHLIIKTLSTLNNELKDSKFMSKLSFDIYAKYEGKWYLMDDLKRLHIDKFSLFWKGEEERPGKEDKPGKGMDVNPFDDINKPKKILFLAANPDDQGRKKTDVEHRKLIDQLKLGRSRDKFEFLPAQLAVTLSNLTRAFNDNPHIVHFSGHGSQEGLIITDDNNQSKIIPLKALNRLFKPLRDIVEIVIFNACSSSEQAKEISKFGMYVVCNRLPITDKMSISFSEGFYNGLGEGKNFEGAFNDAIIFLDIENQGTLDKSTKDLGFQEDGDEISLIEVWKNGVKLDL